MRSIPANNSVLEPQKPLIYDDEIEPRHTTLSSIENVDIENLEINPYI